MWSFRRPTGRRRSRVPQLVLAAAMLGSLAAVPTASAAAAPPPDASAAVEGRNLPPDGKVLSLMGQDSDTLSAYRTDAVDGPAAAPAPGGVSLYTNLVLGGDPPPLAGMDGPANWGAGTVDFQRTLAEYPGSAVAVGLYLSDTTSGCGNQPLRALIGTDDDDVNAGNPNLITQYRAELDRMVEKMRSWDREVFLRIGYEFDGPWNCYNADFYKEAYRYIKGRIDALGATKVATVWQTAAWPLDEHRDHPEWNYIVTDPAHFDTWYPGDDVVDWVGLSSFYNSGSLNTQWGCRAPDTDPAALQERVLDFARAHGKPAMIAEAAPQGYRNGSGSKSCIFNNAPTPASADDIWNEWYAGYFGFVEQNKDVIRAAAYINTDWDSQPQWTCEPGADAGGPGCVNGNWGDSRVQADPELLSRFVAQLRQDHFQHATS